MDMQLFLAPGPFRIDRQSNGFPRQRAAEARLDRNSWRPQAAANTGGALGAERLGSSMPVMRRVGMASIYETPTRSFRIATP